MTPLLSSKRRLAPWLGVAVALACWAVLAAVYLLAGFRTFDLRLTDERFVLRGARRAAERIAIVEIDDATVRAYGRWPLPREQYALLAQALVDAKAAAIGFDVQFLGPERKDPLGDALLAQVSAVSPRVVHVMNFLSTTAMTTAEEAAEADSVLPLISRHGIRGMDAPAPVAAGVAVPYPALTALAPTLAHVAVVVDPDGTVRRIPMFVRFADGVFPSLALRLAAIAAGDTLAPRVETARGGATASWRGGHRLFVPMDADGATAIDYAGGRPSFRRTYSMLHLLNWYHDGRLDSLRKAVEGRIVLVGSTAIAEVATDIGPTPFDKNSPLLYVHANALDSVLRGRFLRGVPQAVYLGMLAVTAVLLGLLFASLSVPAAAAATLAITLALCSADMALFAWAGVDLAPTMLLALAPLSYAAIESYRYVFLERSARERDKELDAARLIQQKLLPTAPPKLAHLDVYGFNLPAREVGGDYFDWITLDDGSLLLALGDVKGKGVPAALLMSHLRASLHAESGAGRAPVDIVTSMHQSLIRAVKEDDFATFFLARMSPDGSQLTYCNAGHNPPFLIHGGTLEPLRASGTPLAMLEDMTYSEATHSFAPGDALIIYSDGVPECPWKGRQYLDGDRFETLAMRLVAEGRSAEAIGRTVLEDVSRFCHGQLGDDDLTMIVVRRR